MKKGHFFVFEGIDGSGKTTQINLLKQRMQQHNIKCTETKEPSDGPVGVLLRQCLTGRIQMDEQSLAALFAADRLDHLHNETNGICSQINRGISVISDRYILSNYAYQSVKTPLDWVMHLNEQAQKTLQPDCHIFLDVNPAETSKRISRGRIQTELFENEERLTAVRNIYLELIKQLKHTENIIIIDGNQEIETVANEIWDVLTPFLQL